MLFQAGENRAYYFSVLRDVIWGCDEKVVHVAEDLIAVFLFKGHQNPVHNALKGRRLIHHAEKHNFRLIESVWGSEGCLPLIAFLDSNIVITPLDVKFRV